MFRNCVVAFLMLVSSVALAKPDGSRAITLVNNCEESVWFGFVGGAVQPLRNPCRVDAECPPNSRCIQTGDITQCFWRAPTPADGNYRLKRGATKTVEIPSFAENDLVWSGAVSGRTKCKDGACEVADCGDENGGCLPSRGFNQPATQAEFTFQRKALDFYDVEIINGVSLPISMEPSIEASNPYFCGSPGRPNRSHHLLGDCTWKFYPPSIDYRWVRAGGKPCFTDAECNPTIGNLCGLSANPGKTPYFQKTCGTRLGYWSADQICGVQPDYGCPFNCAEPAGEGLDGEPITSKNLFACTNVGSCYQNNANDSCCGCVNWNDSGLEVPSSPYTEQCKASNPIWKERALPKTQWLKAGCPTVYTYPYDDMSSTFVCSKMENGINTVDYTITFCPR